MMVTLPNATVKVSDTVNNLGIWLDGQLTNFCTQPVLFLSVTTAKVDQAVIDD